jgi:hypothetical protein
VSIRPQQVVGGVAVAVIFTACLFMHLVLRFGLPAGTSIEAQMNFVTVNTSVWHLGWFFWNGAALCLAIFCYLLYRYSPRNGISKLALALVCIGTLPDLRAEYLLSFELPRIANLEVVESFLDLQTDSMHLTGFYANGLYNLGGLILTLQLFMQSALVKPIALLGIVSWLIGLSLSLFIWAENYLASEWATAVAMTLNLIFMGLVSLGLFARKEIT